jgi:fumarate hydratase class I
MIVHRLSTAIRSARKGLQLSTKAAPSFNFSPIFQKDPTNIPPSEHTEYKQILPASAVSTTTVNGKKYLTVPGDALRKLSFTAFSDVAHLLRPSHLSQVRSILDDPEASDNDKFVALELLKNANIASARVLPGCQDTGTAIVMGKKGHMVLTEGQDDEHLSGGAFDAYTKLNLRYSQVAPLDMFDEKNTGNNLPAQVDVYATEGDEYNFLVSQISSLYFFVLVFLFLLFIGTSYYGTHITVHRQRRRKCKQNFLISTNKGFA